MNELAKTFLGIGFVLVLIGFVLLLMGRFGIPLGRLPGDISYRGKNFSVFFPLGTSILISIVLSAVAYLLAHFRQ